MDNLEVSPQFLSYMLGEPDYWAPGDFSRYGSNGQLERIGNTSLTRMGSAGADMRV